MCVYPGYPGLYEVRYVVMARKRSPPGLVADAITQPFEVLGPVLTVRDWRSDVIDVLISYYLALSRDVVQVSPPRFLLRAVLAIHALGASLG